MKILQLRDITVGSGTPKIWLKILLGSTIFCAQVCLKGYQKSKVPKCKEVNVKKAKLHLDEETTSETLDMNHKRLT